jgi:hypothetical protein
MNRIRFVRLWILALLMLAVPGASFAGVFVNITVAPPPLPVYVQPACPGDGYIWTPGYWAYGPVGYFWVPGTWVLAPAPGLLWTPGYWAWGGGFYVWHAGYWGPHVGFYGGINYDFGYFGTGYAGGYWNGGHFFYNRSVNNITITNVRIYNRTVVNTTVVNRVSYNGGTGGIRVRPTREQDTFARERHVGATEAQVQHQSLASTNREMLASTNRGRPPIMTTDRAGEFKNRTNSPRPVSSDNGRTFVPRPGSDARTENTPYSARIAHNNVPRPTVSASQGAFRGERASRPEPRPQPEPRARSVPQSPNERQVENRSHPQNAPRSDAMPRMPNEPRAQVHNAPAPHPTGSMERDGRSGGGARLR